MMRLSKNALNCWDTPKPALHNVAGNGKRDGLKSCGITQRVISSEAALKEVERSSTKESSLTQKEMAKSSRVGRFFILAMFFIWSSAFLSNVVMADVISLEHQANVFRPVAGLDPINMMGNLVRLKESTKFFFKNESVLPNVSTARSIGMVWTLNQDMPSVVSTKSTMEWVGDAKSVFPGNLRNSYRGYVEGFGNDFSTQPFPSHAAYDIYRDWSLAIQPVPVHVVHDQFFTHPVFSGKFNHGFDFIVIHLQLLTGNEKFLDSHEKDCITFLSNLQEEKTRYSQNLIEKSGWQDKEPADNILLIKKKGDTVVINTLPDIAISDYEVNGVINWQVLAGGKVELKVDRAKYFALRLDDVTLAQLSDKGTLDKYTKHGGETMRTSIDTDFLADVYLEAHADNQGTTAGVSGSYNLGTTAAAIALTKGNITDKIAECAAVAAEQNWPKDGRWMVLPTWAKYLLDTSELKDVGVTGAATSFMVNGGYFKSLYDFDLYISNLYTAVSDSGSNCYNITFGHKSGVTFAAQLTDMTYFDKFENTAGKGMRGMQVFDWKVVKPESVGVLYARLG